MVNMRKIKRDLLIRDSGLDSRFTTKVSKNKKKYNRKNEKNQALRNKHTGS
jgi:hypothetical protein